MKRSGKAASSSAVTPGKLATGWSRRERTYSARSLRSFSAKGFQLPPIFRTLRLSASRFGLPPVMLVTRTVWPVVKSKTRVSGVVRIGSPSCDTLGAPSSRVQLARKLSRSTGDQFKPPPIVDSVPKSDNCSTSALAFSVRFPSALKSRLRRDTGRSKLALAPPRVRLRSFSKDRPATRCSLSRWNVLPPTRTVMLASPAGTANRGPFAVRSMSPEVVRLSDRSREVWLLRSVRVTAFARSPLPVADQRHFPLSPFSATPMWALLLSELRTSGSSEKFERPMSERPSLCSASALKVARADQRTRGAIVGSGVLPDVALVLGQGGIAFRPHVESRTSVAADHQARGIRLSAEIAALRRGAALDPGNHGPEALAKNDVHDALVGPIAVLEGNFLGQDLDPLDRFGRNVAHLAEAGDALAVEEEDRALSSAAARASDLRRQRFQKLVNVRRPGRADVAGSEHVLGRDVANDASAANAGHDDRLAFLAIFVHLAVGDRPRLLL